MTTEPKLAGVGRSPALQGQTVVVIGGSAGIGLETARDLERRLGERVVESAPGSTTTNQGGKA